MSSFAVPVEYVVGIAGGLSAAVVALWKAYVRMQRRWENQVLRTAQAASVPRSLDEPPPESLPPPSEEWEDRSAVYEAEIRALKTERQRWLDQQCQEFVGEDTPVEVPRPRMKSRPE